MSSQQKKSDEKRVFIVGDSIIKNINGHDVSGKTEHCRVYIRPSLGAKVRCMEDHIKLVIRDNPDHVVFHIGTNDVPSDKSAEDIALKKKKKQLYGPFLWMGFNCLKARATSRRQFTFYH